MSRIEIIEEIERLRTKMYGLTGTGAEYGELLIASQELDKFIVMYHRIIG